jgi:phage shock protein PspC (stress-responsive transcriptional regulator)
MTETITHTAGIKRLERSSSRRMLAGVAGGLGRYFDLNPALFRLGFVFLTFLGGAGVLVYLAALLIMPKEGQEQSIAEMVLANRRERPWPVIGLGLAGVALIVLLTRATFWATAGVGWVIVLAAGLVILWTSRGERRSRLLFRTLVVLVLTALAAAITAVAVAFSWFDVSLGDGVGDRTEAPASVTQLKPSYKLGVGDLRVDLSSIGPITKETHVRAKLGIGELRIIVPAGVSVAASAHAKVGEVHVLNQQDDGRNAEIHTGAGGLLVIDAHVGAGRIDVQRAG